MDKTMEKELQRQIAHVAHLESNIEEALKQLRIAQKELDFNKINNSIFLARIALGDIELFNLLNLKAS